MEWDWVRIKTDIINDPKLRRYFDKAERWDWTTLMCLAAKSRERGVILLTDEEISYALDIEDADWPVFEAKLTERRMVHRREQDGALVITHWDRHQYEKPSDTPTRVKERVNKHRANRTLGTDAVDAVDAVDPDNATQTSEVFSPEPESEPGPLPPDEEDVTPLKRDVTPCNTIEEQSKAKQSRAYSSKAKQSRDGPVALREIIAGSLAGVDGIGTGLPLATPNGNLLAGDAGPPSLSAPAARLPAQTSAQDLPASPSFPPRDVPDRVKHPKDFVEYFLVRKPWWKKPLDLRVEYIRQTQGITSTSTWPLRATIVLGYVEDPTTAPPVPKAVARAPGPPPTLTPAEEAQRLADSKAARQAALADIRKVTGQTSAQSTSQIENS